VVLGQATPNSDWVIPLERAVQVDGLVGSPVTIVPALPTATQSVLLGQAMPLSKVEVPLERAVQVSAAGSCAPTTVGNAPTAATTMANARHMLPTVDSTDTRGATRAKTRWSRVTRRDIANWTGACIDNTLASTSETA
jgi:hypothetical protein